jgi:hypothetical protein
MATVKVLELQANTDNAQASLNDVVSALDNINKTLTKTEDEFDNINQTAKKSKGAFAALKKGAKGVAGGFKLMGTALKAAGIGLIIGAFATLKELFEQNQKVVDIFSTSFEFLGLIFSQVGDAIKTVYENVSKSSSNFDALGKVLKNILNIAITPVKLAFEGIKAAIVGAQLVWEKSWLGGNDPERIKELEAELVQIKDNVIGIGEGVVESAKTIGENFVEAVTEVADIGAQVINEVSKISVEATLENAKANVELKKQAELAAVANQGLIEQYDLQAETLRQLRDDERNSIEDRKKANDELAIVLEQQQKTMLENAKISLRAAQAELKKDKDNVEFKKAVMEAENELAAVRAQVAGFRSEQQANDLALSKEELEMTNSKLESEANLSIEQKRFNAEQIEDDLQRLEKQREIDAEEKELQTARLQTVIDNANAGTQAKIDAEIALNEFLEQARQQEVTRDKEINELKVNNNKAANDKIKANEKALQDSKFQLASSALNSISALANLVAQDNEQKAKAAFNINKAVGIAQVGINTSQAIMKAAAETTDFTPIQAFRTANMVAMGVAGALQIAAIAKQKFQPQGGSSSTLSNPSGFASTGAVGGGESQPPSFNVVGQSGFNQIAGALSQQGPVQAFVVASEVTTQQQLDNAIVSTATLGN